MGSLKILIVTLAVFIIDSAIAVEQHRIEAGYPKGLIPDCPGSTKPAGIKPKTLKKLTLSVMRPGKLMEATWKRYNYYHMDDLAKDPHVDFKNKKTYIFIPSYIDNNAFPFGRGLGEAYMEMGYNVLLLELVYVTLDYLPVMPRLIRAAAKPVAEMLVNLTKHGLDPKDLEFVGLSLGGQTSSFIAKRFREMSGKTISTIVALDPTGTCFRNLGPEDRLDKSDADFVLVISTNIDGFGIANHVGHVTFYVNGGEWQPGDTWWFPCGLLCSHARALFLYQSALNNPGKFLGVQCDTVQQARDGDCFDKTPLISNTLDHYTDRSKPGMYYLTTTNLYPYYVGKKGLMKNGSTVMNFIAELNKEDMIWI